ncbi:MAG: PilN domain-containing protein [bacterium]|nr:PilN domain-containing protein [bacterium]
MIRINLLPKRKKKSLSIGKELTSGVIFLLLLFGAVALWYHQLNFKIENLQRQISETKRQIETSNIQIDKIKKLKEEKKEVERKLNIIKELKSRQKGPAPLLNQLSLIIPDEIWLSSLSSKGSQLSLEGMSLTANNVADFMKSLENTGLLRQIELDKTEQRAIADNKKVQNFKIICNLVDSNSQANMSLSGEGSREEKK